MLETDNSVSLKVFSEFDLVSFQVFVEMFY